MKGAAFLVFPSECYEVLPTTLVEAFATGLPVIASARGAAQEMIDEGRTGRLFTPGDASALAAMVAWASESPQLLAQMGREARHDYASRYSADVSYEKLMLTYDHAERNASERRQ
jgi:glycosyltransferase involved in cell wall biosynthesis